MSERITVGIVEFVDPTLLLIGSKPALYELADLFAAEAAEFHLRAKALLNSIGGELSLHPSAQQTRLLKAGNRIDWFISSADAKAYAELVRAIADSDKPSHAYLDVSQGAPLDIVVSKDEYDPNTVFLNP